MAGIPIVTTPDYQPPSTFNPTQGSTGTQGPGTAPSYQDPGSGSDYLQQLWNLYGPQLQTFLQQQQMQQGSLQDQLMMSGPMYQYQAGNLQGQADYNLANNQLTGQGYDIQRGALQRQEALLPQEQQLALESLAQQKAQAQYNAGQQTQASNSAWTPTGNYTSIKHGQELGNIQQQLAFQMANIGRSERQNALDYGERTAALSDSEKQLDLMSQRLGLSNDEIRRGLQNNLDQLGLSSVMDVEQLVAEMGKMAQGSYSPIAGLIGNYIYPMGGYTLPYNAPTGVVGSPFG